MDSHFRGNDERGMIILDQSITEESRAMDEPITLEIFTDYV
jgi:hypothetical protein